MQRHSILIVDDEEDILEFLKYNFEKQNYTVFTATNGDKGIKLATNKKPDVIILDIMMDGMDGIQVCEKIKEIGKSNDSLIMFLTARGEDFTQIAGFDAGADDFVTKPINPKVLIKRVQALLNRKHGLNSKTKVNKEFKEVRVGKLVIDRQEYKIVVDKNVIILPRKEFNLLELIASSPDKVFTREEIFDNVWGDTYVGDRTIDVHIRKLREKLGEKSIHTIKGVGYKLNKSFF